MFLAPLGLVAGALDAMGGGGWGPIGTPTLLASGRMEPRKDRPDAPRQMSARHAQVSGCADD